MPSNPYQYDPSIDDDIFGMKSESGDDTTTQHQNVGAINDCSACDVMEEFRSEHQDHSSQFLRGLGTLIHMLLDEEEGNYHSRKIFGFFENLHLLDLESQVAESYGISIDALTEVLDELTEGRASKLINARRYERHLWAAHRHLKSVELSRTTLKDISDLLEKKVGKVPDPFALLFPLMETHRNALGERVSFLTEKYIEACEQALIDPVTSLIREGAFPDGEMPIPLQVIKNQLDHP